MRGIAKTHEKFLEEVKIIHPTLKVLTTYKNAHTHILIQDEFGICSVTPLHILQCKSPSIVTALNKNTYFEAKANKVHNNKYKYSFVNYIDSSTKVKILCNKHGIFEQIPKEHLTGRGCPTCGLNSRLEKNRLAATGWKKEFWKKCEDSISFDAFKVYVIECWDGVERFFKIGRTSMELDKRFASGLPYSFKIVFLFHGNHIEVYDMEKSLKDLNIKNKYLPRQEFYGKHECFSKILIKDLNYE